MLVSCLSYRLSPLATCCALAHYPCSSISVSPCHLGSDSTFPSILSWYPYILSLFPGSSCGYVQYTYTSTLIPHFRFLQHLSCNPSDAPSPLSLIFFRNSCFTCASLTVGFQREPLQVPFIEYFLVIRLSYPCNYPMSSVRQLPFITVNPNCFLDF